LTTPKAFLAYAKGDGRAALELIEIPKFEQVMLLENPNFQ
jgi:hypothetical protein